MKTIHRYLNIFQRLAYDEEEQLKEAMRRSRMDEQLRNQTEKERIQDEKKVIRKSLLEKENRDQDCQTHSMKLSSLLKEHNLCIKTVPANGDCFFNATIAQLQAIDNNCRLSPRDLREKLCDHIAKHEDIYAEFLSHEDNKASNSHEYYIKQVEMLRKRGKWTCAMADLLPTAMSNMLSIDIIVYSSKFVKPIEITPDRTRIVATLDIVPDKSRTSPLRYAYLAVSEHEHYDYATPYLPRKARCKDIPKTTHRCTKSTNHCTERRKRVTLSHDTS